MSNNRVDSLALWKITRRMPLDPKKSRQEILQQIFVLGIFWVGVSRYAATPMIVALSPGHRDITRFRIKKVQLESYMRGWKFSKFPTNISMG